MVTAKSDVQLTTQSPLKYDPEPEETPSPPVQGLVSSFFIVGERVFYSYIGSPEVYLITAHYEL